MIVFPDLEELPWLEYPPEIIPRHAELGGRKSLLADCRKSDWPVNLFLFFFTPQGFPARIVHLKPQVSLCSGLSSAES